MPRIWPLILLVAVLAALALFFVVLGPMAAEAKPNPGACYEPGAKKDLARARAAYLEAVKVARATRTYSRHDYSDFAGRYVEPVPVGRWVRLAHRVGWSWACIDRLMHIIARESSGYPGVVNHVIGCTGLLQIWPGNVSQPGRLTDPEYNLRSGLKLYREAGWQPWAVQ